MINFHPPMSGLPLAGALLLLVVECGALWSKLRPMMRTSRPLAVVACLVGTSLAFVSGYQASSELGALGPHIEADLAQHHSLGRFGLICCGLMTVFFFLARAATHGKRLMIALYYVSLLGFLSLVIAASTLGGELVFTHGLGVSAARP